MNTTTIVERDSAVEFYSSVLNVQRGISIFLKKSTEKKRKIKQGRILNIILHTEEKK